MTKQAIIEHTVQVINQLPEDKAAQVSDFADFLFKRYEEQLLAKGIEHYTEKGRPHLNSVPVFRPAWQ